jgi:hypothetical protein
MLISQLFIALVLTGLIWTIQLVHYPSFAFVDPEQFSAFHDHHNRSISFIVMPLMLAEMALAVLTFLHKPSWILGLALAAVILIWITTFTLSVPCHQKLAEGFDLAQVQRLVATNWPRTVLWTARSGLLACLVLSPVLGKA